MSHKAQTQPRLPKLGSLIFDRTKPDIFGELVSISRYYFFIRTDTNDRVRILHADGRPFCVRHFDVFTGAAK